MGELNATSFSDLVRKAKDPHLAAAASLIEQIKSEIKISKPTRQTPFEELKVYITDRVKHTYQVFMARQTTITVKHMARLQKYIQSVLDDFVRSGVLKRANAVCDWRVNTTASIADGDLVCFIIYETLNGSVISITVCQNPIHARIDALQAAKQMPGIRRI